MTVCMYCRTVKVWASVILSVYIVIRSPGEFAARACKAEVINYLLKVTQADKVKCPVSAENLR